MTLRLVKVHDAAAVYPPVVRVNFKPPQPKPETQPVHLRDLSDDVLLMEGVSPRQAALWLRANRYAYVVGTNGLWARQA